MSNSKPILYSYFRSSCSWRIRMALAFKGIEYETKFVNLVKNEQLSPEFLSINPSGQVPAFVSKNGQTITQSPAILEFLEEEYPEKNLLPKDSATRAKVREICAIISCGTQPIQNLAVMRRISDDDVKRQEWAKYWIEQGFQALEKLLSKHSGKYSVGDTITLADCFLVPQVYNANRFKADMSLFPTIARINETLVSLDIFKQCHPSAQPDCPPELKS